MLFNSVGYIFFLSACVGFFYILPKRFRPLFLLGVSLYFYLSFRLIYIILLATTISSSFFSAIQIEKANNSKIASRWLLFPLVLNLGLLFFFKYYDFSILSVSALANQFNLFYDVPLLNLVLPVGISFYTFQIISYLLDVYWGKIKAERNPGIFALYVAFFPKLVTGPIERAALLIPQFKKDIPFSMQNFRLGLFLILLGFFQKILIADNLALYADAVFNNVRNYQGLPLVLAAFAFAFQMFTDFSGYTDIALGSALLFGIQLSPNFRRPFVATSITEFWRRWHISLSSWANDYLYKPIAFQRRSWGQWGVVYAVTATFLFLGIWHGARFSFILFGFLMGLAFYLELLSQQVRERFWNRFPDQISKALSILLTFLFFTLCSVFFRANTTSDGFYFISHLFQPGSLAFPDSGLTPINAIAVIAALVMLEFFMFKGEKSGNYRAWLIQIPIFWRWGIYLLMVLMILLFGEFNEKQFIYVEF